jgi:pyruvate kinase
LYSAKKIVSKLWVKEVVIATNDSNIVSYLSTLKFTVPINVITSDNLLYKWANFLYSTRAFYVDDENMQYSKLKWTIAEILKKQANWKLKSSDKILIIYPLINNTSTVIHNGMELVSFLDL